MSDDSLLIDCPSCRSARLVPIKAKMICPRCGFIEPCCEGGPAC